MTKGGGARVICSFVAAFFVGPAFGQGQDSTPAERDLMVIAEMLEGGYSNANQAYFDHRVDREIKHQGLNIRILRGEDGSFVATGTRAQDKPEFTWNLNLSTDNDAGAVRMTLDDGGCSYLWRREAAQFRASPQQCGDDQPQEIVLSAQQLWVTLGTNAGSDYELHRVRDFKCYVDIPGVGGGRPIPYDRYGEFEIHDQGGSHWFTSKEGREIGVSLLLVDWPINNYEGVFSRDSFVIYVSERVEGERKELGYAFTVPEADRIGINLKWMLAMCYVTSNKYATPSM